uniref:SAM domain-containing protein n=1 Tax=Amphilophus citrinellus TaxID=61819 RepID=A0A3Q0SGV8_AMPCI
MPLPVLPSPAETPLADDFICDPPVDSRRYAIDPSDSAFSVTSQYQTNPGSHQEGNRNGEAINYFQMHFHADYLHHQYCPMSDPGECKRPVGKDPSSWGVEDVVWFIKDADPQALGPHAEAFRKHEIDGDALLLLKSEMMMKYLGLKLGPALKLCYHIDRLKQSRL